MFLVPKWSVSPLHNLSVRRRYGSYDFYLRIYRRDAEERREDRKETQARGPT